MLRPTERRAPLPVGWALKRARELLESVPAWIRDRRSIAPEVPPRRLRARTGAPGAGEFVQGGLEAAQVLAAALESSGMPLARVREVLDFGCGSGRVLPHIAALVPAARCSGCDVDREAVAWAQQHHPQLRWATTGHAPPLPFAQSSFDAIYSISVFSHLDERLQDHWLKELRRVLRPGGIALLSVHGHHALEQFRSGQVRTGWCRAGAFQRGPLGPDEFVSEPYIRSFWNRAELPRVGASYGLTFHGSEYVRRHWPPALEVIQIRPRAVAGWQDLVICRRPVSHRDPKIE